MQKPFYPKQRKKYTPPEDEAFDLVKVYLPKATAAIVREKSIETKMAVSRLIAYAVDNELDAKSPFFYPTPMPTAPYLDYAYVDEAGKVLEFLKKFPGGASLETLTICRRDIGLKDAKTVAFAVRELVMMKLIEEFKPTRTMRAMPENYTRFKVMKQPEVTDKTRYKRQPSVLDTMEGNE